MVSQNLMTLQVEVDIAVTISTAFGKKTQKKKLNFNPWEALRPEKNILTMKLKAGMTAHMDTFTDNNKLEFPVEVDLRLQEQKSRLSDYLEESK